MAREFATLLFLLAFSALANAVHVPQTQPLPTINVAIITDGSSARVESLRALFLKEMRAVNHGEFDLLAPPELQLTADRTLKGVNAALDKVLANPRTDLVITLGILASHAAAMRKRLPKPVIAPLISNHDLQDLPYKQGSSGRRNLSYVSLDINIQRDLAAFREIVPFTRLAFLIDGAIASAMPGIRREVMRVARELKIEITTVTVAAAAGKALAGIPGSAEAVYVGPMPALSAPEYEILVNGLIERRLPSFAVEGKSDVMRGILVGIAPAIEMNRLARRVALNTRRILLGEGADSLPVAFARAEGLTLNMRTARAIGFSPAWQLLTRAELLYEEPEPSGPPLSLVDAVKEALERNLSLRLAQSNVKASKENIRQARSSLLPQLGLNMQRFSIEEDDASATPGRSEHTTQGSLQLDQVIYSEPAMANLAIQKHLHNAREREHDRIRLDIVLEATQAYLDVLYTKANLRLHRDNLKLSRTNLELARARRRIGTAGPSEVYRWESEIANAQRVVVEAEALAKNAQIALNALLHRPLEQIPSTVDVGLTEPTFITSQPLLFELIANPASFVILRDFIVKDALATVPELRQLDAHIQAGERSLQSARRAYWQPELALRAERTETLAREGAQGTALPGVDDTDTSIALQLSIPLFTSGARGAQKAKAYEELTGLRLQRQAIAEGIEQRVRAALHTTRSAYTAIRLSREAADAAESHLAVVREAYSRGTVSILELLDAQNAALVADLRAATAVYDFTRALMTVERAAARFDFFLSAQDQADWFARLENYFKERGMPVRQH